MILSSQKTKTKVYSLIKYQIIISFLVLLYSSSYSQSGIIDGTPKIAYWEYGNTDPSIIIINGGPGYDHTYLRPEWDTLSSISRIIYYDQRGCGESDNSINYSWIEHLKDLKRLKDHLSEGKKVILAGSSWGTFLAILYAIYFPYDIKGLILSGVTDWRGGNFKKVDLNNYQIDSINNFRRILPISHELDSIVKAAYAAERNSFLNRPKFETWDTNFNKRLHAKNGLEVNRQTSKSYPSMPDLTFITEIKVPALIFKGNMDCGYGDWSDIFAKLITGSELYPIMNTCHDPWFNNPKVFFPKCIEFINRINH
jgi:pimeloyl-ACP methyl ester carboxylesterase